MIDHGNVCDVSLEAREAAGVEGKIGWEFEDGAKRKDKKAKKGKGKKKELTEQQKRMLEKLKKCKKK